MSDPGVVTTLLLVAALVGCVLWVLQDARAHASRGRPVEVSIGSLHLDGPETWACACLVLWVFFFPLYLRARAES